MAKEVENKNEKLDLIREYIGPMIGLKLTKFETGMLKFDDDTWEDCPDLPIRLFFEANRVLSVSWAHFERLFLANDLSLPFEPFDIEVVWRRDRVPNFSDHIGKKTIRCATGARRNGSWGDQGTNLDPSFIGF